MNRLELERVEASLIVVLAVLLYGLVFGFVGFVLWLFWS